MLSATLDHFAVANGHTKSFVLAILPVLPLTRLAAVEDKLATRTCLEQQVRAVAGADTAGRALSLVACARLIDIGEAGVESPDR